jgi:hypothetical protein
VTVTQSSSYRVRVVTETTPRRSPVPPRPTRRIIAARFGTAARRSVDGRSVLQVFTNTDAPDSTAQIVVRDLAGHPVACVLCSDPLSPQAAARAMARAREVKAALGPDLGEVVLEPLEEGAIDGLSYAVLPYRTPSRRTFLGRLVYRGLVRFAVYRWIEEVAAATVLEAPPASVARDFAAPLAALEGSGEVSAGVRAAAATALRRLGGPWTPHQVLMHGDLWDGNILLDHAPGAPRRSRRGFVVIDWETARLSGYPMYDLIRLAIAHQLPAPCLARELERHCRVVSCAPEDARSYLMAALGHLACSRNHMPLELFQESVASCHDALRAVGL